MSGIGKWFVIRWRNLFRLNVHFDLTEVDNGRRTGRRPSVTSLKSSGALSARQAAARFDWVYRARP